MSYHMIYDAETICISYDIQCRNAETVSAVSAFRHFEVNLRN